MRTERLFEGPVGRTLLELAAPMVLGLMAVIMFNVVDTFYVGRLGALQLAAMGFSFPVVFFVMSIAMGLGIGVTSVIARAIGEGDRNQGRRLTTDGLILANSVVVVVAVGGLLTIRPLFSVMGADKAMVDLIAQYMVPWYIGIGLLVIPMVGNSAIRATGDTKTPSFIMIVAGVVNVILDPFMIFGIGPFPRLELQGAAIASVISWTVTFAAAFWILSKREKLIDFSIPRLRVLWNSWKRILYVGIPATGTSVLIPLSMGVLTRMISAHGAEAVAAFGVGTRIQSLSIIGITALSAAVTPFVGQNFGAGNFMRIRAAVNFCFKAALIYGVGIAAVLAALARPLAVLFNDHAGVQAIIVQFLLLIPITFGPYGISLLVNQVFNASNKPMKSAWIIVLRLFVFAIPFAWIGSILGGVTGIFVGIAISNVLIGVIAAWMVRRFLAGVDAQAVVDESVPSRAGTVSVAN